MRLEHLLSGAMPSVFALFIFENFFGFLLCTACTCLFIDTDVNNTRENKDAEPVSVIRSRLTDSPIAQLVRALH